MKDRLLVLLVLGALGLAATAADVTHSVWFRPDPGIILHRGFGSWPCIVCKGDVSATPPRAEAVFGVERRVPYFKFRDAKGRWVEVTPGAGAPDNLAVGTNQWTMLTAVHGGDSVKLYVDGRKVAERKGCPPSVPSDDPVTYGALISDSGVTCNRFTGRIEPLVTVPRALGADEVAAEYRRGLGKLPAEIPTVRLPLPAFDPIAKLEPVVRAGRGCATLKSVSGVPRLFADGEIVPGAIMVPYPSFADKRKWVASIRDFRAAATGIVCPLCGEDWWLGEGRYDFDAFDARLKAALEGIPEARLILRIRLDGRPWWTKDHPGSMLAGFAVPEYEPWRKLQARMLEDVVRHVESSPFAPYVVGYHFGAMLGTEWISRRSDADPRRGRYVSDVLLADAALVKRLTGRRKLVGVFFGYGGLDHADTVKVMESGDVDYFCQPTSYTARRGGAPGLSTAVRLWGSLRLRGMQFLDEADLRTHVTADLTPDWHHADAFESVGAVKRALGYALTRGWGIWWFAIAGYECFHDPEILAAIRRGNEVLGEGCDAPAPAPEVGVFHRVGIGESAWDLTTLLLPRTGVDYEQYASVDRGRKDLPKHKLVLDAWKAPTSTAKLRELCRQAGVHVYLDTDDVVSVGRGYLMVHAATAGEKTVRLPGPSDVREVFGTSEDRHAITSFTDAFKVGETRVYRILGVERKEALLR